VVTTARRPGGSRCSAFWTRLKAQGKPGKAIVVACMHKLLAIAYGMLRSGQPFGAQHLQSRAA